MVKLTPGGLVRIIQKLLQPQEVLLDDNKPELEKVELLYSLEMG